MTSHDTHFKQLLRTFFKEFLQAFVPELSRELKPGSIVELDSVAGEPVDVLVNGYLIAQGEVVVVNGKFGIRLTDVVTPSERFKRAGKG